MGWEVKHEPHKDWVAVKASGTIQNEDAKAQAAKVICLLKKHKAARVLVDYAKALSEVSLPEVCWLANQATLQDAPWHLRLALVLPVTHYRLDSYQFFELVFRSAGYEVKLFEKREGAARWLAQTPQCHKRGAHLAHA
ncbi:MAG TPA: STAS/SEC14 domain-containing protein [Candidatus Paceibacterota bacterium]|nr:STAS/SEC14 domain-containing protein [Verrucomicrobiota bacterium]HSA08949.1 STAS/SEC14 domain-containing protein [Candidatus Paceibacterota bacterium]